MARIRSLGSRRKFRETYGKGVKRVGHLLVVYVMVATRDEMAVVASRKVGNAVKRNRAKRLLREAVFHCIYGIPGETNRIRERLAVEDGNNESGGAAGDGLRVIAIARSAINSAKCQDVRRELTEILR